MHILKKAPLNPQGFKLNYDDGVFSYSQLTKMLNEYRFPDLYCCRQDSGKVIGNPHSRG